MSSVAEIQVQAEKERLVEARNIAQSEKGLYVRVSQKLDPPLFAYCRRGVDRTSQQGGGTYMVHCRCSVLQMDYVPI